MLKLTFLGDIMCDSGMANTLYLYYDRNAKKYDFGDMFVHVSDLLSGSDYVMANLETPIAIANQNLTHAQWEFNSPLEFADAVKKMGVDYVSTANNHCLDRGISGLKMTIDSLNAVGLDHSGTQRPGERHYSIACVKGIKIGILSYTYGTNAFSNRCYLPFHYRKSVNLLQEQEGFGKRLWGGIFRRCWRVYYKLESFFFPKNKDKPIYEKQTFQLYRKALIRQDMRRLKKEKPDYIVVYLHIGGQYNDAPTQYTIETTDWMLKEGADVVIGNHEHVVHGSKVSNGQLATYSMGNFVSSAGAFSEPYDKGAEYSIALHVYIGECDHRVQKVTFSVLKTIIGKNGKIEVWPIDKLVHELKNSIDNRGLETEALNIANVFSGKNYDTIESEFLLHNGFDYRKAL